MPHTLISSVANNSCPPMPACPTCGGLECLCRPRWFAGQTITEDDLRALDHYMIEKNKLHNRYLHGAGTVCGLQVLCHECKGWVTITSGYALDPCGNDIIVCNDYPVDVCAMIQACCTKDRNTYNCEPMASPPPDCRDIERDWYITLRYRETSSRGITALKNTSPQPCCSRCGNSSGGCGCGSHPNGHQKQTYSSAVKSTRVPLPQCEPTRTCEGFVVELAPVPPAVVSPRDTPNLAIFAGTFLGEVMKCSQEIQAVKKLNNSPPTSDGFINYKRIVWEFMDTHPLTRCQLLDDVKSIKFEAEPDAAFNNLDSKLNQLLHDCICAALLPPCPHDPADPRVILAKLTVKTDATGCRVLNICHQAGRQFVLTSPNILYWSSIGNLVKQVLENACCGVIESGQANKFVPAKPGDVIKSLMASIDPTAKSPVLPLTILTKALGAVFEAMHKIS